MRGPRPRRYPTDLSDAEWAALEPLLPPPARRGRPLKWPRRLMVEAIFHLVRSGCAWRMLPRCFPPWPTVSARFRRWRLDGTPRLTRDRLRALAREAEGRAPEPSAATIDSQTTRGTGVGGPARGYDPAKRTAGRKRHILVDAAGLVLLAHVHAADLHDRLGARALVGRAAPAGCRAWDWSGRMALTPAPPRAGSPRNAAGASGCPSTATGTCGATDWKRSRRASTSSRGGGSWSAPSRGCRARGGWHATASACRRRARR